ncbi:uncharacterized protein V6R79_003482 [Siganus canaliculatus]
MALIVSVSGEFSVKCFTCLDQNRCANVEVIYGIDDSVLYVPLSNDSLPGCSESSRPTSGQNCTMCRHENITIICLDDVTRLDVEDSDGYVRTHQTDCVPQSSSAHGHDELMAAVGIYLVLLPCFLCWWQF